MPKPTKGPRIGGSPSHQRIILANLATQLFKYGKITTTLTRAKRVQPLAEHLITKAKRGDMHALRVVRKTVTDVGVLDHLFKQIGPSMEGRDGGYTRITKLGTRLGDAAPMAQIEIVTEKAPVKIAKKPAPKVAKPETLPADDADEAAPAGDVVSEAEQAAEEELANDADEN